MESHQNSRAALWVGRIVMLLVPALLVAAAVPRFQSGLAIDAAFPVPVYMVLNVPLRAQSYVAAVNAYASASLDDGQSQIERGEAASHTKRAQADVIAMLTEGISHTPAAVRGWMLIAEQMRTENPKLAAAALTQSFLLGPYEYFIAGRRARDAARLWTELGADGREAALRQTRLLWSEPTLREGLEGLLALPEGPELVGRAFKDQPDDLRALNRYMAARRRGQKSS